MPIKWKGSNTSTTKLNIFGVGSEGPRGEQGPAGTTLLSVFNGSISTMNGSSSPEVLGSTYVDPTKIGGTKMVLEGSIASVGGGNSTAANLVLFNKTSNSVATTVSTTLQNSTFVSSELNMPASPGLYEVRLYVSNATGATSAAVAYMARLRFY